MFESERLRACPGACRDLTGTNAAEFERRFADFLPAPECSRPPPR